MELDEKKYNQLLDRIDNLVIMEQNNRRKLRYTRYSFILLFLLMVAYMAWDQFYPKKIIAKQIEIHDAWGAKRAFLGVNQKDNAVLTLADKNERNCLRLTTTVSGEGSLVLGGYESRMAFHGMQYSSYIAFNGKQFNDRFIIRMDNLGDNESIEMLFIDNNNNEKINLNLDHHGNPHFIIDGKER